MAKQIFSYSHSVNAFYNDPTYRPTYYQRFYIALRSEPENPLFEIITNASGYGRWVYSEDNGQYRQVQGTCQYHVPGTIQGMRKALRSGLKEMLEHKANFTPEGLTDQEVTILEALC